MALGWPLLLGIVAVLVLRWRDVNDVSVVALVGLTPFLLAPLVAADIVAWFSRSRTLRIAAAAVTAACLFTIAPFDAVIGCRPSTGDDAITIMTANVMVGGGRADAIAATIVDADPDLLLLQETSNDLMEALAALTHLDPWSHRTNNLPDSVEGAVVWSRWPLSDVRHGALTADYSVEAAVDSPLGRFTVASVHVVSPTSHWRIARWHEQYDGLRGLRNDEPIVMGGDFNATEDHRPFRLLLDQGWTDVHDDKGCGPDFTWSSRRLPAPVMRLDHVLVTDHFEVLSTEIGDPVGSDHRPVISRIRFADR